MKKNIDSKQKTNEKIIAVFKRDIFSFFNGYLDESTTCITGVS